MRTALMLGRFSRSLSTAASSADVPRVLSAMIRGGLLCADVHGLTPSTDRVAAVAARSSQKCAVIYDGDALDSAFKGVQSSFPTNFIHALAIKSAPLGFIVRSAIDHNLGIEAASFGEAASALRNGCARDRILFDSPAKTMDELRWALEAGLTINADSLEELERLDVVIGTLDTPSSSTVGLRINPLLAGGAIDIFAVSKPDSKFGHPLHNEASREAVHRAFARYPWLSALHSHVGSAGTSLTMLAQGAQTLARLADEVDARAGSARITALDIGGGLHSSLESDAVAPSFGEYEAALRRDAPELFGGERRRVVYTEFGRALLAKVGWIAAQVEYVKIVPTPVDGAPEGTAARIATCHAGADIMMRQCYNPDLASNQNRLSAYNARGEPIGDARGPPLLQHVAGPLCFAGDYPRKSVSLPPLEAGDWIVFHDTGANSLALWSRHCSRLVPPVYSYARDISAPDGLAVKMRKAPEPLERLLDFWE